METNQILINYLNSLDVDHPKVIKDILKKYNKDPLEGYVITNKVNDIILLKNFKNFDETIETILINKEVKVFKGDHYYYQDYKKKFTSIGYIQGIKKKEEEQEQEPKQNYEEFKEVFNNLFEITEDYDDILRVRTQMKKILKGNNYNWDPKNKEDVNNLEKVLEENNRKLYKSRIYKGKETKWFITRVKVRE